MNNASDKVSAVFKPPQRLGKDLLLENADVQSDDAVPAFRGCRASLCHGAFIVDNKGAITDFYDIDKKKKGEGSYGAVYAAKNKTSGAAVAVKSMAKSAVKNLEKLKQETTLMRMMDHPNIVKLFESFEDFRNIYLVMELCLGGELFERIVEAGHFKEVDAAMLMNQMFQVIHYMHENKVVHRDLKPENFLFSTKEPIKKSTLKIIDFGLSKKFEDGQVLSTKAGTPYYVSPQVLAGKYDKACDLWSSGVIMFVLLCGYPPFHGDTDQVVLSKVRAGHFCFKASDWKGISDDAKNLVRMLLKIDPRERITAQQAMNHAWVTRKAPQAADVCVPLNMVENLRSFRSHNRLKKAALHLIAHQMNEKSIKKLRQSFLALDEDHDGLLTASEMKKGLQKSLSETPSDLQEILEQIDTSGDGVIDYTEFIAATLEKKTYVQEDICWSAFRFFDRDGNGKISRSEIAQVLNDGEVSQFMDANVIAEFMKEFDTNGDGEIDFAEFMDMMRSTASARGLGSATEEMPQLLARAAGEQRQAGAVAGEAMPARRPELRTQSSLLSEESEDDAVLEASTPPKIAAPATQQKSDVSAKPALGMAQRPSVVLTRCDSLLDD